MKTNKISPDAFKCFFGTCYFFKAFYRKKNKTCLSCLFFSISKIFITNKLFFLRMVSKKKLTAFSSYLLLSICFNRSISFENVMMLNNSIHIKIFFIKTHSRLCFLNYIINCLYFQTKYYLSSLKKSILKKNFSM